MLLFLFDISIHFIDEVVLFVCLFAEDILNAYNVWKARGNFPPDADKKVTLVFVVCSPFSGDYRMHFPWILQVKLMCSYCKKHNDKVVPDPYYGGAQGFEKVTITHKYA